MIWQNWETSNSAGNGWVEEVHLPHPELLMSLEEAGGLTPILCSLAHSSNRGAVASPRSVKYPGFASLLLFKAALQSGLLAKRSEL